MRSPSLRDIPAVEAVLRDPAVQTLIAEWGRLAVRAAIREQQDELRTALRSGHAAPASAAGTARDLRRRLLLEGGRGPRPVFNLTGTVIHTNLGRASLPQPAIQSLANAARDPVDLEYDLAAGRRGHRDQHVTALLCGLTGAEAATVVNNNAAALMLVLNTLALEREVPVSRGELIEIGGSFRLPDIMARSGCRLREVGTTNRTHLDDYDQGITAQTGLLLKVHRSNYVVEGFTAEVDERQLAALARQHAVPLVVDLGSGALVDLERFGLPAEPTPMQSLGNGADLVTFSGDKLLGGPQAGIIVGRRSLVERLNANPMKRALRVDKLTLAALAEVLKLYTQPERLADELPVIRQLARKQPDIRDQADRLAPLLAARLPDFEVAATDMASQIGSGALPQTQVPSAGLRIAPVDGGNPDGKLARLTNALRALPRPVIGRVHQEQLWLDLRCLEDEAPFVDQLSALELAGQ